MSEQIGIASVAVGKCKHCYIKALALAANKESDFTPVKFAYAARTVILTYISFLRLILHCPFLHTAYVLTQSGIGKSVSMLDKIFMHVCLAHALLLHSCAAFYFILM